MVAIMKSPLALASLLLSSVLSVNAAGTFTPAAMLSAPRRGTALPNAAGTLALYSSNTHNFTTHSRTYGTYVMDLATGASTLYTNSSAVSNVLWLGSGNKIFWLSSEDDGTTSAYVGDATTPDATPIPVGSFPGPIDGVKAVEIGNGTFALAFSGPAAPNGTLYNSALAETPVSTGLMYTTVFVRHWDTYITPVRNSVWYTTLSPTTNGTYKISETINALNGTGFESPIPPFGGTDNYDISKYGIVFVAKDITLNQVTTTKSDVWYLPLKTFKEPAPKPLLIETPDLEGASAGPVFSPTSPALAFVRMKDISYESDKNRLLLVPDVTAGLVAEEYYKSEDGKGSWDRSPASLFWSPDGKTIYIGADDRARTRLFSVPADPAAATAPPTLLHKEGSVLDVKPLSNGKLIVSSSSFLDNSIYELVDPAAASGSNATGGVSLISANLKNGAPWGLSRSQISEIYYKGGDGDYQVHAWVIKPSFFKENQTYPLAFYIHGGPQGATSDVWSTRWNMMVFAEQGYVVVAFNPTGSTSFGQELCDSIQNQWGGKPYLDLVEGYKYIEKNLPYVDLNRTMALGASYGGYMVYWIQGHELGRKFKALFAHDGSLNTLAQYASEELWFMQHDFNGTLWDNWDNYARWNPANHTDKWETPMLVVHNELDYRLPVSEGIMAFNILQTRGVPSKFLSFPNENHWVLRPENSLVWHKAVLDWLNGHVGLPAYSKTEKLSADVYVATQQNGPFL